VSSIEDGLEVTVDGTAAVPRVTISGELDLASADQVRLAVTPVLGPEVERIELDLAAVEFLDSSGLSVLLELAAAHPVRIVAASVPVQRIVTITGLDEALGLAP